MTGFWTIIAVTLFLGGIGGIRNYSAEPKTAATHRVGLFVQRMIEACAASSLVPLLLSLIGNDIIGTILDGKSVGNPTWLYAILKLIGFSTLAALNSKRFLDSVFEKVLKLENEIHHEKAVTAAVRERVEENSKRIGQIDDLVIEDTVPFVSKQNQAALRGTMHENAIGVLDAFLSGRVPARTVAGLSLSAGITSDEVESALKELSDHSLVRRIETARGVRWSLTSAGNALLSTH